MRPDPLFFDPMFFILLLQQIDPAQAQQADDHSGQQHSEHNRDSTLLEIHVQEGCGQSSGPGAGSRDRDADEEQQRYIQTASGFRFQFFPAVMSLLDTEREEFADIALILTPFQYLSCKEEDNGTGGSSTKVPMGIAPRSSTRGTMEIKKVRR